MLSDEEKNEIEKMTDHDLLVEIVVAIREADQAIQDLARAARENPMLASMGLFE